MQCGGPQPIVLRATAAPCRYCKTPDPLPPEVRQRVRAVAKTIEDNVKRHRLPDDLARSAGDTGWMAIALIGGCFLVSGGITWLWASDMLKGTGILTFLREGKAPGLDRADTVMMWWLLFLQGTLLAAAVPWVSGGQALVYWSLGDLKALPPLSPGGAARCHLCGDDLPPEGVVRRCKSCGCDNLVAGARFRAAIATQAQALDEADRLARQHIGVRIAAIENGILWAAGLPFSLIILVPVLSLALSSTHPGLLWLPAALLGLGILLRGVGALLRPRT